MNTINNLERKFGRYAIRNLSMYIVICFAISYVLCYMFEDVYYLLVFSPYHIFVKHQFWRLFTWIFSIPESFNIFTLIMMFFYFSIGNSIERSIGSFMYNLYIFGSLILTGIGSLIVSAVQYFPLADVIADMGDFEATVNLSGIGGYSTEKLEAAFEFVTKTYVNGSYMTQFLLIGIFLGFALIHSDAMVLLYFVIPFRVSWLAYIDIALMVFEFISNKNPYLRVNIFTYLLAFGIMYYLVKKRQHSRWRYGQSASSGIRRKRTVERSSGEMGQVIEMPTNITKHKCAICGRSERDGDELEFRFCSKCNGNYEYCNEHLYTHEHIK